ncbi:MAG: FAD-dependent oxidoreductase [Hyphomicrobiaceae bacterium]
MTRNPRYDILFEPVRIGPVTAPNRFFQTAHASGMGHLRPASHRAMREVKAEGGWGVVTCDYCSIDPTSDDNPYSYLTLWDDDDARELGLTADAIHRHGSLAAIELWHGGALANNRQSRTPLLAPSARPAHYAQPMSARAMDLDDIRHLLAAQAAAAKRAVTAGFDIVYVYAGHGYLPFQFLSPRHNRRTDLYGGSLANRSRLLREMIEVTGEAVAGKAAVAVRMGVDELAGPDGFRHDRDAPEVVSLLADLPDLWDFCMAGSLGDDSKSARFSEEGFQERYVAGLKQLTRKPVVSVGRFTSPDRMVSQLKRGIQDFIGAARPSIADPFLPSKIRDGREDDIRECIGCNICRSANNEGVPLRCTQNPAMGEEWRRGWHPERIAEKASDAHVLIVGGGPAGLECALALGKRGYRVTLADRNRALGGRLLFEATLPGLSTWMRVRDHRLHQLAKLPNVETFLDSAMTADDILGFGADHVVLATGSCWRRDGIGSHGEVPLAIAEGAAMLTPDDIAAGAAVSGPVLVYDDDHYFMGGALAEKLRRDGHEVTLATAAPIVSSWTQMTDEQAYIEARLAELGVGMLTRHQLQSVERGGAVLDHLGSRRPIPYGTLVLVTGRSAETALLDVLKARDGRTAGIKSITAIGDALSPSSIADAVFAGHRYARLLDSEGPEVVGRERPLSSNTRLDP